MKTSVRIYLLCYDRNDMLPRALSSLINQTVQNWICEVHCDKPDNNFPAELIGKLNDSRIHLFQHQENLGLTAAFNLPFREVKEEFISILEEDNWWEPSFLEDMLKAMKSNPECAIAWSNMRIWKLKKSQWIDTGSNIWNLKGKHDRKFQFPHIQQITSALHSQGSMLVKMQPYNPDYIIPFDGNSGALEAIRERAMSSNMLFVNKVLGNYAMLEQTHRTQNTAVWTTVQLCLIKSFFKKVTVEKGLLKIILKKARGGKAKSIHIFLLSKLMDRKSTLRFNDFTTGDYLFSAGYFLKNRKLFSQILKKHKEFSSLDSWLMTHTKSAHLNDAEFETCQ